MNAQLAGGCLCGTVRYTLRPGFRMKPYACHCTDCQRRTGSAFSLHMLIMLSDLDVSGELDVGTFTQPSGALSSIYGCAVCKARIYAVNSVRPGTASLRLGTLDHPADLPPQAHLWVGSKHPWIVLPDAVPQLPAQPAEMADWMALLGPST
jgi:hypothetical protein